MANCNLCIISSLPLGVISNLISSNDMHVIIVFRVIIPNISVEHQESSAPFKTVKVTK